QRLDGSTYLEYMSAMGEEIMELTVEEVLHNMHLSYDTIHPDFRRANLASETDATETMQPFQYEYQINVDSGKTKWLQANARAVKRENGEIAWYGVLCDISDRKQTEKELLELNQSLELRVSQRTGELQAREKQLRELSERLALSLKSGAIGCWEWDIRHDLLTWDERMYELYGVKPSKPNKNYAFWINRLHPDDRAIIEANFEKALVDQAEFNTEYRVIYPDGSIHFIESYSLIQRDEEGKPQSMIGINLDVSSRKQAEELIRQQVERESLLREITQRIRESLDLKTIFETATQEIREFLDADRVAILQFSHDSNFVDSEFVAESVINGFISALGKKFQDHCFREKYHRDYQQGKIQAVNDIYENGMPPCLINLLAQFQVRASLIVPLLKGTELWGLLCIHQCDSPRSWQPLEIDLLKQIASQLTIAIQQASLYQQVQNELEENHQLFLQLTRELEQKKILLKEIHHRVKNNLQVMSSIMYLQFGKASPEIKALSEEYQNRLQSIAVLHEQLYRGNNLSDIDISQYITTLSKNLFQCYAIDSALITLKMEVNEIYLPLDQSIPLGLIMNELISNALKHAFPQGQGEITISLIESEKQISLTIADNGIGLPTDFDLEKTDTLGMQLIISFTQQLEGELTCNSKNGSIFQITFPSL
ncbi:MAG: PAS domain-containing sensor histidine kinase, partial [Microcoleaceae cyanobacterium]